MKRWAILFLGAVSLAPNVVYRAEADELQQVLRERYKPLQMMRSMRPTLAPLTSIRVEELMSPDFSRYGIQEGFAKPLVELRLRRNGVPVHDEVPLSAPEPLQFGNLVISIEGFTGEEPGVTALDIHLVVWQPVNLLASEAPTFLLSPTWDESILVLAGEMRVQDGCRNALEQLADRFSNDWLAAHSDQSQKAQQDSPAKTPPGIELVKVGFQLYQKARMKPSVERMFSATLLGLGEKELGSAIEPNSSEVLRFMAVELSQMSGRPTGYVCVRAEDVMRGIGGFALITFWEGYAAGVGVHKKFLPADYTESVTKRAKELLRQKQESRTKPAGGTGTQEPQTPPQQTPPQQQSPPGRVVEPTPKP
jgi:hypothetical protein